MKLVCDRYIVANSITSSTDIDVVNDDGTIVAGSGLSDDSRISVIPVCFPSRN